jgi:hypothetical protein
VKPGVAQQKSGNNKLRQAFHCKLKVVISLQCAKALRYDTVIFISLNLYLNM